MEKIISYERTTGMGAHHATQMLFGDGTWSDVSEYGGQHIRRVNGWEVYEYTVDLALWPEFDRARHVRAYHRSNSGNETVVPGQECLGMW